MSIVSDLDARPSDVVSFSVQIMSSFSPLTSGPLFLTATLLLPRIIFSRKSCQIIETYRIFPTIWKGTFGEIGRGGYLLLRDIRTG